MPKAGVWSELILPINNFTLTNCGLINVEDGAMNTRMVRSLGITMHDGKEGPFKFSSKGPHANFTFIPCQHHAEYAQLNRQGFGHAHSSTHALFINQRCGVDQRDV